jgi:DNA-binding NarL/FixJ family response regulator
MRQRTHVEILVADDHELVRSGIGSLLAGRRGWKICAEVGTGEEAVELAAKLKPDIAILDISMPKMDGLVAARMIRERSPETKIMLLTLHDSPEVLQSLLRSGVQGYVLKSDAGRTLLEAGSPVLLSRRGEDVGRFARTGQPWGNQSACQFYRTRAGSRRDAG